jgi:hypothetical protein
MKMITSRFFSVLVRFFLLFAILLLPGMQVKGQSPRDDEGQIKTIIDSYFKIRYESSKQTEAQDLTPILAIDQAEAQKWNAQEKDRDDLLKLEAKLFKLDYLSYKYSLDYQSIIITGGTDAIATLLESNEVVFEILAPQVSKLANSQHVIYLKKTGMGWRIVRDDYHDDTVPPLNSPVDKENAKNSILRAFNSIYGGGANDTSSASTLASPRNSLSPNTTYTYHPYNSSGAVAYANHWANARNLAYYNFSPNDCTNFVSQAMHDSTGAGIAYDTTPTYKWFFNTYPYPGYSYSWTGVPDFYVYMTNPDPSGDWTGPYGTGTTSDCNSGIAAGDIVQIATVYNGPYDHAGMLVHIGTSCGYTGTTLDAHDNDRLNYPLSNWAIYQWRFVHIQGSYTTP